jgi:hypothetical protein
MTSQDKNTEALILDAARRIFIEKGYDGARMQESPIPPGSTRRFTLLLP